MTVPITPTAPRPEGTGERGILPSYVPETGNSKSGTLSDSARDALFSGAKNLKDSGASDDEVKAYVSSELEANGAGVPAGAERSGQLVDEYA